MLTARSLSGRRSGARGPLRSACAVATLASIVLLAPATGALASGPASVSVRVLGRPPAYQALTPLTDLTTTTTPVTKDGAPASGEAACTGTSAAGALELATKGDWAGNWDSGLNDYEVTTIDGIELPFEEGSLANYTWGFLLNDEFASTGVCATQPADNDQLLFFPSCYGASCPPAPNILALEIPPSVETKTPVRVTVLSYPDAGCKEASPGTECPAPAAGVTVSGGEQQVTTDSEGHATISFGFDSTYPVRATSPPETAEEDVAVPAEALVCAHEGDDGTCGTKAPSGLGPLEPPASSRLGGGNLPDTSAEKQQSAIVASATGLLEGHRYSRKHAPRVLSGVVFASSSVVSISISLRRTWKRHCYDYNGARARLQRVRCSKRASFFRIGHKGSSFSYLLPARLPAGRYVFEVKAIDTAGDHTKLTKGSSRIIFDVG
jgi:hypothetical protein